MGMLVDGEWLADDERHRRSNDGAFVRPASAFRGFVTADRSSGFPAEDRRYHLYAALSCPWAHRALIMRAVKGLEECIPVSIVAPCPWQPRRARPCRCTLARRRCSR